MLFINDDPVLSRGMLHTGSIQEKEQIQQEKGAYKYDWSDLKKNYYPGPLLDIPLKEVALEAGHLKTVRKRMWERKDLITHQMESRRDN